MKRLMIIAALLFAVLLISCGKVADIPDTKATLTFKYNGIDVSVTLSEEESDAVKNIFNNKHLYIDNPECAFTEDVSVRFGDMVFCIACDSCSVIKYQDKYFSISDSDRETINRIFENHGGFFPCV